MSGPPLSRLAGDSNCKFRVFSCLIFGKGVGTNVWRQIAFSIHTSPPSRNSLAASARKKSPTLYTPIYFSSVHYLPFRRLNYCPGVMKCEERSNLLEKRACASCSAKSAEFFDFLLRWIGRFYYSRFQFTHQNLYICTYPGAENRTRTRPHI